MVDLPRLLFPVTITIEKKNTPPALQDHLRREPIGRITAIASFQIPAQVSWGADVIDGNTPLQTPVGRDNGSIGYVIVRTKDLAALGKKIDVGDKISKIGPRTVALYVNDFSYHAHRDGDFQLEKYDFTDRVSNG